MATTFAEVAVSRPALEQVIADLGLQETPESLGPKIDARPSQTSAVLTIVVHDIDASRAAGIANALAKRLLTLAPTISGSSEDRLASIQADLARVQGEIQNTETTISQISQLRSPTAADSQRLQQQHDQLVSLLSIRSNLLVISVSYSQSVLTLLAPAPTPVTPSSPSVLIAALIGAIVGLALGLVAVVIGHELLSKASPRPAREAPR
jgi:capsular polysaccharide biosynthesis protein